MIFAAPTAGGTRPSQVIPFPAIAQAKKANPLVLINEIEKAAIRSDYWRLWDTLLGFLEPETNTRYPDPLQVTISVASPTSPPLTGSIPYPPRSVSRE